MHCQGSKGSSGCRMPDTARANRDRAVIRHAAVPAKLPAGSVMLESFACTDNYAPL